VLEEIVGEIADEYDTAETPPIMDLGNGKYRVSARLSLDELGELFGIEIAEEDVDTAGGLLAYALGRVPLPGSKAVTHGLILKGEAGSDARGRVRVHTLLVRREPVKSKRDNQTPETGASGNNHGDRQVGAIHE
jgi:CBS domain containing-hemolysin-like protein